MRRLGAVMTVAAVVMTGCARTAELSSGPAADPANPANPADPADPARGAGIPEQVPLPPPEALTAVISRLADPAIPGADKLGLVEKSGPADAAALDGFATALRDGGFAPAEITATDIRWSQTDPGTAVAAIAITAPQQERQQEQQQERGQFSFPMEFRPGPGGWQLTHDSAEMLLAPG